MHKQRNHKAVYYSIHNNTIMYLYSMIIICPCRLSLRNCFIVAHGSPSKCDTPFVSQDACIKAICKPVSSFFALYLELCSHQCIPITILEVLTIFYCCHLVDIWWSSCNLYLYHSQSECTVQCWWITWDHVITGGEVLSATLGHVISVLTFITTTIITW